MTTLFVPWIVFPLVLALLSLGCGLLTERVAGLRLPRTLLLPVGLATLSLAAQLATMNGATAKLAAPLVLVLTVAGYALSLPWTRPRLDRWAAGAAVGAFAVYAAPIVLTGTGTFAGYVKLDDDSTFLAMTDRVMDHGRSLAGLEPSTYFATLTTNIKLGYPLATFMPLGVGHELVGSDGLWLFQPYLAFMMAMLALSLYELGKRVIGPHWLRALAAFVAAQAALLYGYALWGGIKEIATAWVVPLVAALVPTTFRARARTRSLLPIAVACAALLGILNLGAAVWLAPVLLFAVAVIFRLGGPRRAVHAALGFTGLLVLLALPTIVAAPDFLNSNIVGFSPLANLIKALSPLQMFGIWANGDFRLDTAHPTAVYLLIALVGVAAVAGVLWALRRQAWELPIYSVGAIVSALIIWGFSTPWIAGKAFASAAPALLLAAFAGCAVVFARGRRIEGAVLVVAVTGGVLWSNALQYHDAFLAPRKQLGELQTIGHRFAGDGPALMTEYNPYGVRHFLRDLDPEGASELRFRPVTLRTGGVLDKGAYADLDAFQLDAIQTYRTLVLRRSPVESRPPSSYRLAWKGHWYEAWQRPASGGQPILEHLPLGTDLEAAAMPDCSEVQRLASLAGSSGELAAVPRQPPIVLDLTQFPHPESWGGDANAGVLVATSAGKAQVPVDLPSGGRWGIWLGGSFRDGIEVSVDGRRVGSVRYRLNNAGMYTPLAEVDLTPGRHVVTLDYSGADWRPGSGGPPFAMGPLVLSRETADLPVIHVAPAEAAQLCGKSLDWIEALGAPPT